MNKTTNQSSAIQVGDPVRIITGRLYGKIGTIKEILNDTMSLPDGESRPINYYIVEYTNSYGSTNTYFAGRENIEPESMTVESLQFALTQIYPPIPAGEVEVSYLLSTIQKELENPDEAIAAALSSVKRRYTYTRGKGTPFFWFQRLINRKIVEHRRKQKREGTYQDPNVKPMPVNFIEDDDEDDEDPRITPMPVNFIEDDEDED